MLLFEIRASDPLARARVRLPLVRSQNLNQRHDRSSSARRCDALAANRRKRKEEKSRGAWKKHGETRERSIVPFTIGFSDRRRFVPRSRVSSSATREVLGTRTSFPRGFRFLDLASDEFRRASRDTAKPSRSKSRLCSMVEEIDRSRRFRSLCSWSSIRAGFRVRAALRVALRKKKNKKRKKKETPHTS